MKNFKRIIISILTSIVLCFNANALSDALKLKITKGTTSDETVIRFLPSATPGFDASYDAYKMFSTSTVVPSVFSRIDTSTALSVNALPQLTALTDINVFTQIKVAGTYTLQAIEMGTGFPAGTQIILEDSETGIVYNFRGGQSVTLTLPVDAGTQTSRFKLHFSPPAVLTASATQATCYGFKNGSITASITGNTNWDYELRNSSYTLIASGTGINETTEITGLAAGSYILYTGTAGLMNDSASLTISEPSPVIADFSSNTDTVSLSAAQVAFYNNSINATNYTWDFGDGYTSDSLSPSHSYTMAGNYNVDLIVADSTGCTSEISKNITVNEDVNGGLTTGISQANSLSDIIVSQHEGAFHINMHSSEPVSLILYVYNNLGQVIYQKTNSKLTDLSDEVPVSISGTYIISSQVNGTFNSKTYSFIK